MNQKERWEAWTPPDNVLDAVRLFFEIMDGFEVSDAGRAFRPTTISSVRSWDVHRLGKLLPKIREMFEIKPLVDLRKYNDQDWH